MEPSVVIEHRLEIAAPVDLVWEVITDLSRYPEWNPFVVSCRSTLVVGEPIHMRVKLFGSFAQPQTETILEHVAQKRLCYGVKPTPRLASRRWHEVRAIDGARTEYVSHFELSGWLAGTIRVLM